MVGDGRDSLTRASKLAPGDAAGHLDLGRALAVRAGLLVSRGEDARAVLAAAQAALGRAAELSPGMADVHIESARSWLMAARQEELSSGDPMPDYGRAIEAARRAIAIRPDHLEAHFNLGLAHLGRAELLIARGQAAAADLALAVQAFQQSLAIDPGLARTDGPLAGAAGLLAERQHTAGADPTETLIIGRAPVGRRGKKQLARLVWQPSWRGLGPGPVRGRRGHMRVGRSWRG